MKVRNSLVAAASASAVAAIAVSVIHAVVVAAASERIWDHIRRRRARANAVNQVLALLLEQGTHLKLLFLVTQCLEFSLHLSELRIALSRKNLRSRIRDSLRDVASLLLSLVSHRRESTLLSCSNVVDSILKSVRLLTDGKAVLAATVAQLAHERCVAILHSRDDVTLPESESVSELADLRRDVLHSTLQSIHVTMNG